MIENLGKAVLIGGAGRLLAIPLRLLTVPLTVSLLSAEQYGLWMVISAVIAWFSFSDLGIPSALQNRLVSVLHSGDARRAQSLVTSAFRLIGGIGIALFLAGLLAWGLAGSFGWSRLTNFSPDAFAIFLVCLVALSVGLPSRIGGAIFSAHGRMQMIPAAELTAQLGAFGLLYLAVFLQWKSVLALVTCSLVSLVVVPLGLTILAGRTFGYSWTDRRPAVPEDRRSLLGKGGFFALTMIGELLILQSDALLIGLVLGLAAVPLFAIPAALWLNFLQAQNIFLRPLWPVLSQAKARGDRERFLVLVRRTILFSFLAGGVFAIGLVGAGDWFVRLWSKGIAGLSPWMAGGFALYVVVASVDNVLATVLNAVGMIEQRFRYTLIFGLTKLLVGWLVLSHWGIEFLPLAYGIVMLLTSLPFAAIYVRAAMRKFPDGNARPGDA